MMDTGYRTVFKPFVKTDPDDLVSFYYSLALTNERKRFVCKVGTIQLMYTIQAGFLQLKNLESGIYRMTKAVLT